MILNQLASFLNTILICGLKLLVALLSSTFCFLRRVFYTSYTSILRRTCRPLFYTPCPKIRCRGHCLLRVFRDPEAIARGTEPHPTACPHFHYSTKGPKVESQFNSKYFIRAITSRSLVTSTLTRTSNTKRTPPV